MQEVPSEMESDSHSVADTNIGEMALVPLPVSSSALDQAKQMLHDIQNNPDIMNGTETIGEIEYGMSEEEKKEQQEWKEAKDKVKKQIDDQEKELVELTIAIDKKQAKL